MRPMLSKGTVIYQSEMGPQRQPTTDCFSMDIAPFLKAIVHFYNYLRGLYLHGKTFICVVPRQEPSTKVKQPGCSMKREYRKTIHIQS